MKNFAGIVASASTSIAAVAALSGQGLPLPPDAGPLLTFLIAPFGAMAGFAVGSYMTGILSGAKLLAWCLILLAVGLILIFLYVYAATRPISPSIPYFVFFEALPFLLTWFCFYAAATILTLGALR